MAGRRHVGVGGSAATSPITTPCLRRPSLPDGLSPPTRPSLGHPQPAESMFQTCCPWTPIVACSNFHPSPRIVAAPLPPVCFRCRCSAETAILISPYALQLLPSLLPTHSSVLPHSCGVRLRSLTTAAFRTLSERDNTQSGKHNQRTKAERTTRAARTCEQWCARGGLNPLQREHMGNDPSSCSRLVGWYLRKGGSAPDWHGGRHQPTRQGKGATRLRAAEGGCVVQDRSTRKQKQRRRPSSVSAPGARLLASLAQSPRREWKVRAARKDHRDA